MSAPPAAAAAVPTSTEAALAVGAEVVQALLARGRAAGSLTAEEAERFNRLFAELVSLEQTVRALRERGIGAL